MKKMITLCLIVLASKIFAQPTSTVEIMSVFPYNVCVGQDIVISFKYLGVHNPNQYFSFHYLAQNLAQYQILALVTCTAFYSMTKALLGPDTIYSFIDTIPPVLQSYNQYQVVATPNFGFPGRDIQVLPCEIFMGINNYQLDKSNEKVEYYDLNGNIIIDPRKNELMIKKVGNTRYKVIIQD